MLTRDVVARLLRVFREGRCRAYCTVVLQCGLRLNEALHIKSKHIHGERLVIHIPGSIAECSEVPSILPGPFIAHRAGEVPASSPA